MQDRYAGDVGDFAKFGLLRALLAGPGRRPGVAWYYVPPGEDQPPGNDGRHTDYLARPDFRRCDPDLHETLGKVVASGTREVAALGLHELLGPAAIGFAEPLPGRELHFRTRASTRKDWLQRADATLRGCDGVFLDPDNGIASRKVGLGDIDACKFAFLDEVALIAKDRLCVVYHHLCRQGTHVEQIHARAAELAMHTRRNPSLVTALRWRPYSPRAFFILATPSSGDRVKHDVIAFLAAGWGAFFENIDWRASPRPRSAVPLVMPTTVLRP